MKLSDLDDEQKKNHIIKMFGSEQNFNNSIYILGFYRTEAKKRIDDVTIIEPINQQILGEIIKEIDKITKQECSSKNLMEENQINAFITIESVRLYILTNIDDPRLEDIKAKADFAERLGKPFVLTKKEARILQAHKFSYVIDRNEGIDHKPQP